MRRTLLAALVGLAVGFGAGPAAAAVEPCLPDGSGSAASHPEPCLTFGPETNDLLPRRVCLGNE